MLMPYLALLRRQLLSSRSIVPFDSQLTTGAMAVTKKRKLDDDDAQSDAISDGAVGRTGRLKDYIASR